MDDKVGLCLSIWVMAILAVLACIGCKRTDQVTIEPDAEVFNLETQDPAVAATLQADLAATAAQLSTLAPLPTPTDAPFPTFDTSQASGTPITQLTGICPVPDGYIVHSREEFCVASPALWVPLNVDGGLAIALNTTPGKTLFLQPDWAASSDVCQIFLYTARDETVETHLNIRHAELADDNGATQLTDITVQTIGILAMPGFLWTLPDGSSGGTFADRLGPNRIIHISFGGSQCPITELEPVINTLRLQTQP
jgi:hypothetical protein